MKGGLELSGWSCPYQIDEQCKRVRRECLPGQKGCVLAGRVVFAEPDGPTLDSTHPKKTRRLRKAAGSSRTKKK